MTLKRNAEELARTAQEIRAEFTRGPVAYAERHTRVMSDLLLGKTIDMPPVGQVTTTFKKASKAKADMPEQLALQD